jgi:hypothetical protein
MDMKRFADSMRSLPLSSRNELTYCLKKVRQGGIPYRKPTLALVLPAAVNRTVGPLRRPTELVALEWSQVAVMAPRAHAGFLPAGAITEYRLILP